MSKFLYRWQIRLSLGGLLLLAAGAWGEPPRHFYVLGWVEEKSDQRVVYKSVVSKLHTETKHVLASRELPKSDRLTDLALSGDGQLLFGTDAEEVIIFDAGQLSLRDQFSATSKDFAWGGALFVHPKSGLLYVARVGGSNPVEVAIVDPRLRKIVKVLKLERSITRGFVYDPTRDRLYVTAASPAIIDPRAQQVTGYIKVPTDPTIFWMLLSRDGKELLLSDGGPHLYAYDLDRAALARQVTLANLQSFRDPALSRDGTRLFAATSPYPDPGTAVVIDTQTLSILHTLTFQEPIGHFVLAPDGRGMWLTTKNGVLRLDDQTGKVVEQVSLPFRLGKLLTPPGK